jgi:hypothetical protein
MQKANAISRMPAMLRSTHAMGIDPIVDSPGVAAGRGLVRVLLSGKATVSGSIP